MRRLLGYRRKEGERIAIPAVRERCAGIDIGKRRLAVAFIAGAADQPGVVTTREFGTTVPELQALQEWLLKEGCTSVAMQSTGPYWIPVKNEWEGSFELVLVCSQKHKPKKADKTDFGDAKNLGHQHRHGLLTPSFLPEKGIMELRDLTRRRKKLLSNLRSEKNRIQKMLEMANVQIGNIVSDVLGISGQKILSVLLSAKEVEAAEWADMARGQLRQRIPELTETLKGQRMHEHYRWLIDPSIEHIILLDKQLEALEDKIRDKAQPYAKAMGWLQSVPGIKDMTSAAILAETGADMNQFETSQKLAKWAGICPSNNESAGKRKSGRIRKANRFWISALVQAAWGAVKKQDSVFQKKYYRWVGRLGKKKTKIGVCPSLLRVVWVLLKEQRSFQAEPSQEMRQRERVKQIQHHAKRLRQFGADETALEAITEKLILPKHVPVPEFEMDRHEIGPGPDGNPREDGDNQAGLAMPDKPMVVGGALGFRARQPRIEKYSHKKRKAKGCSKQRRGKKRSEAAEVQALPEAQLHPEKPKATPTGNKPKRRASKTKAKPHGPVDLGEPGRWISDILETQ